MTQAARAVAYIRRHRHRYREWPTYGDMLWNASAGCSPWKRLQEGAHKHLGKGERLVRLKNRDGLVTFAIVKG